MRCRWRPIFRNCSTESCLTWSVMCTACLWQHLVENFISDPFKVYQWLREEIWKYILCFDYKLKLLEVKAPQGRTFFFLTNTKTCQMCFPKSQQIWMGSLPTDCARIVLHEGTLTVCSEGIYLNLADIHMGGKRREIEMVSRFSLLAKN